MRSLMYFAAFATLTVPAVAQPSVSAEASSVQPVAAKRGATIFDKTATRLGTVLAVRDNGAVVINFRSARVTVPAETLSIVDGKLMTSLTKAEVGKLD
jgi:hypothetical protein